MIRRAEGKDRDAILNLAKGFATSFVTDEEIFRVSFGAILDDSSAYLAVAEDGEAIRGYVLAFSHNTLHANGRVAWVEEITVDGEHRRQGLGKALMHDVEEWATHQDCKLVALATRRAANFYEAMNYHASATYFRKLL